MTPPSPITATPPHLNGEEKVCEGNSKAPWRRGNQAMSIVPVIIGTQRPPI